MQVKKSMSLYSKVKLCFFALYMTVFTIYSFIPYQRFVVSGDTLLYLAVPILGICVLVFDIFKNRNIFKIPYFDILLLFFVFCTASIFANFQYSPVGNIKTLIWMALQILLFCGLDANGKKNNYLLNIRVLSNIFIVLHTIGTVLSFVQFIVGYGHYVGVDIDGKLKYLREGFIEARLFGVFTDPNYACVAALLVIVLIAINFRLFKLNRFLKTMYIIAIVFNALYIVLSGSRTGELALCCIGAFTGVFLAYRYFKNKARLFKLLVCVVSGIVTVGISFGAYTVTKAVVPYMPTAYDYVKQIFVGDDGTERVEPRPPADMERDDISDGDNISNGRITIWTDCLRVFAKTPIFGTSPDGLLDFAEDNFDSLYIIEKQYCYHNGYIALLVGSGLLSAVFMMLWLFLLAKDVLKYLFNKHSDEHKYLYTVFLCSLIIIIELISAVLLMALFFSNQTTDLMFWMVLGWIIVLIRNSDENIFNKTSLTEKYVGGFIDKLKSKLKKA